MTNEKAKKEAIRKAYGEHWDIVKDKVTEWGALSYQDCSDIFGDEDFYFGEKSLSKIWKNDFEGYYCPTEIFNLSHNNGWTRIEPDGSNLPNKKKGYLKFLKSRQKEVRLLLFTNDRQCLGYYARLFYSF